MYKKEDDTELAPYRLFALSDCACGIQNEFQGLVLALGEVAGEGEHGHGHLIPCTVLSQGVGQVVQILHGLAVKLSDDVVKLQACGVNCGVRLYGSHQNTLGIVTLRSDAEGLQACLQLVDLHAQAGVLDNEIGLGILHHLTVLDQLVEEDFQEEQDLL